MLRIPELLTDGMAAAAYVPAMPENTVDREWFKAARLAAGVATDADLAKRVGLHASAYSLLMKGGRALKALEAQKMSSVLNRPVSEIMSALQRQAFEPVPARLAGYVSGAERADQVVIYDQADEGVELVTVHVPFMYYPGSLLEIRGESMAPRYKPGEIIGVRMNLAEAGAIDSLIGRDVVAFTADQQTLLKRLEAGDRDGRYTLVSVNPLVLPLLNVALQWAVPVDILIPKLR